MSKYKGDEPIRFRHTGDSCQVSLLKTILKFMYKKFKFLNRLN
jgi:hypothetical protein